MGVISMKQLLEAGVHFGHQTRRWNPKMAEYIYTARGGIHIIDLQKTVVLVEEAYQKLLEIGKNGGKVLFVGTKKQARDVVKEEATRTGQYYVSQRWLGGTLTNFKTIRKSIKKLHDLDKQAQDGTFEKLTKKEVIAKRKEMDRLEKFLSGIKEMRALPQAVFVVDPMQEKNAVLEARKLGIPVFGIVDTNCDPDLVDVIIPGNDDAIRSVKLIVGKLADAFIIAAGGVVVETPQPERQERRPYTKDTRDNRNKKPYNSTGKPYTPRPSTTNKPYTPRTNKPYTPRTNTPHRPYTGPITATIEKTADGKTIISKTVPTTSVVAKPVVKVVVPKVEVKVEAPKKVEPVKIAKVSEDTKQDLNTLKVTELRSLAKQKGLTGYSKLKKAELIAALK